MQTFGENTLQFQYIQELLYSVYVPTVPVFSTLPEVKSIVEDQVFITPSAVMKKVDDTLTVIRPYTFGERVENISQNYISTQNYYSTGLHEALGRYLRFYRDYYNIDLMPLYNCFSNKFVEDFSLPIKLEEGAQIAASRNPRTKLFAVPVVPGKTYQIAIDASGSIVKAQLGYYDGQELINLHNHDAQLESFMISTSFNSPQLVTVSSDHIDICHEKYLHLFIELPYENDGSIVVLERYSPYDVCIYPYLIKENQYYQYAFSDKLFEYLVGNVIVPGYEFQESIADIQKILGSTEVKKVTKNNKGEDVQYTVKLEGYSLGTFDESTHSYIYNLFRAAKIHYPGKTTPEPIRDFTGYVDSDVEYLIHQMRSSGSEKVTSTVSY